MSKRNRATEAPLRRRSNSVLELKPYLQRAHRRRAAVSEAQTTLEQSIRSLTAAAINIAISDSWHRWDQDTPEGTVVDFSPEVLATCTDPSVQAIASVLDALHEAAGAIEEC